MRKKPLMLRMFVAIGPARGGVPKKRKDLVVTSAMPIGALLAAESYQYEEEEVDEDDDSELETNPLEHEGRNRLMPDLDSDHHDMIDKWAETAEPGDMLTVNSRAVIVCIKSHKQIVEHRKIGLESV